MDGQLYILQARPETVKSQSAGKVEHRYKLTDRSTVLAEGLAIGQKIGSGPVRLVKSAAAIVTNRGGRTCHAAIIARELGIPAVVG